jgi:HK97 family phage major capsid protein/HK97 family phage prohead protease
MPTMNSEKRVVTTFEIRAVDETNGKRRFSGIASTPSVDSYGDIVEPKGMQASFPTPLLWMHKSGEPIGWVTSAKVTSEGIFVECEVATIKNEGELKAEIDKRWDQITNKLVGGLSIGFSPIEHSQIDGTWGYRFTKWKLLELSCVTIPANSDCSIETIKSADKAALVASGRMRKSTVVRFDTSPGASGTPPKSSKEPEMESIKTQIDALMLKRQTSYGRMDALMKASAEKGLTLDAAEKEEYDTLNAEVKEIDEHVTRLKDLEARQLGTVTPVDKGVIDTIDPVSQPRGHGPSGIQFSKANLAPGVRFARFAQALVRGAFNPVQALACIHADPRWMKETPELALVMKGAIAAGDTTTSGWASELVYAENLANEFIEYLRPKTIVGRIPNFRRVPFNVRVGGLSGGTTGYWVGQGKPIPVSKGTSTSVSLGIAKVAGITAIDNELARLSTPSAELMIRDDLGRALIYVMDDSFINPNNGGVTNVSPASMLYGVAPVVPTGTTYAAMRTDLQTLMEAVFDGNIDTNGSVWIMSQTLALKLSMMVNALDQKVNPDLTPQGGRFQGYEAIVSQVGQIAGSPQHNDILIWLHPNEVFMADDGQVTIEASKEVALEMLDNPTNQSTGSTAATSMVSMFQTESMAIKAVRFVNWTKRRSLAAQWIQNAAYTG